MSLTAIWDSRNPSSLIRAWTSASALTGSLAETAVAIRDTINVVIKHDKKNFLIAQTCVDLSWMVSVFLNPVLFSNRVRK